MHSTAGVVSFVLFRRTLFGSTRKSLARHDPGRPGKTYVKRFRSSGTCVKCFATGRDIRHFTLGFRDRRLICSDVPRSSEVTPDIFGVIPRFSDGVAVFIHSPSPLFAFRSFLCVLFEKENRLNIYISIRCRYV